MINVGLLKKGTTKGLPSGALQGKLQSIKVRLFYQDENVLERRQRSGRNDADLPKQGSLVDTDAINNANLQPASEDA